MHLESMARRYLPRSYSRELPRLTNLPLPGFPRVNRLMLDFLTHVDAQLNSELLCRFIAAFHTRAPLMLGELWAVPILLRLGLIENGEIRPSSNSCLRSWLLPAIIQDGSGRTRSAGATDCLPRSGPSVAQEAFHSQTGGRSQRFPDFLPVSEAQRQEPELHVDGLWVGRPATREWQEERLGLQSAISLRES